MRLILGIEHGPLKPRPSSPELLKELSALRRSVDLLAAQQKETTNFQSQLLTKLTGIVGHLQLLYQEAKRRNDQWERKKG